MPRTFKTVDYEAILEQKVSLRECLPPDSSRLKAYRYRIYSSHKQKVLLAKSFDSCRWFSNYALNLTHDSYKATGRGLSRNEIINQLPELKKKRMVN